MKLIPVIIACAVILQMAFGDTVDPRSERIALVDLKVSFSGKVANAQGDGIEGANLVLQFGPTAEQKPSESYYDATSFRTDANGNFAFSVVFRVAPDVSSIELSLRADHDDYLPGAWKTLAVSNGDKLDDLDTTLDPGGSITGVVKDNLGNPIPGALVNFSFKYSNRPDERQARVKMKQARCDNEGRYTRGGLYFAEYYVVAAVPGYAMKSWSTGHVHEVINNGQKLRVDIDLVIQTAVVATLKVDDGVLPGEVTLVFQRPNDEAEEVTGWVEGDVVTSGLPPLDATSVVIKVAGYEPTKQLSVKLEPAKHTDIGELTLKAERAED